ncbi:MAG: bifunctional phosphoribosyl-AMP cyclohydrolase/phosphoribosyl-ATP diphosphatase HisIE [Candidatus Peregrinibacteria bacterium]
MKKNLIVNWQKYPDRLVPAIIQDSSTERVLMLGYMSKDSLSETRKTGFVTFFSRSKKRLWKKGEESGNTLKVVSITPDCDKDALLIRAAPKGPTCHTGSRSCFSSRGAGFVPAGQGESTFETLGLLIDTIRNRSEGNDEKSYTKKLLTGGIDAYGAKVLEEAEEVVRAARNEGKKRTIEEAADVLYHLLVLLRGEGIELEDVAFELRKRRK